MFWCEVIDPQDEEDVEDQEKTTPDSQHPNTSGNHSVPKLGVWEAIGHHLVEKLTEPPYSGGRERGAPTMRLVRPNDLPLSRSLNERW